jgi:hypothetical protein
MSTIPHMRHENVHIKDTDDSNSPTKLKRNYQTRSEEKRDRPLIEQRKFTAIGISNKHENLDLSPYSKERSDADLGDEVVFNGTFAK